MPDNVFKTEKIRPSAAGALYLTNPYFSQDII
jgi:hypothetical protein